MRIPIRVVKGLIWVYASLGVLMILAIGFALFIFPMFSPDGISTDILDLMEKVLLYWGVILLPFMKIAQVFVNRHHREKSMS